MVKIMVLWPTLIALMLITACGDKGKMNNMGEPVSLRVATFNVEDIRTEDLLNPAHPRLKWIAATIQQMHPDIILINEIAYDQPGAPGFPADQPAGKNGQRLADNFLNVPQAPDLKPLHYRAYMAPSNTGIFSGFDLNNDGLAHGGYPTPPGALEDGSPGPQTPEGRAFGADCWGFGTFPGQYAMALLVREDWPLLEDKVRTFQKFLWKNMPGAMLPTDPETGQSWYDDSELAAFRLSSKSHWDVPVQLPNNTVLHLLCSHPTPPAFDGPEKRNKLRNHDEIRFWADYLNGEDYLVDDAGSKAKFPPEALFIIMGDQNADPQKGNSIDNPIETFLLSHPRVQGDFVPQATSPVEGLEPQHTARWGMRVDYVLPSTGMKINGGGVWRYPTTGSEKVYISDHFPVWLDLVVPGK